MILILLLIQAVMGKFGGFYNTYETDSFVVNSCSAYAGQHICLGFNSTGKATSTIIQYSTFSPNITLSKYIYGIKEYTGSGMAHSFSTPMYFVSKSKIGGAYSINVTNASAQLLHQHNYSSYYRVLIREGKGSVPIFYYFLVTNNSLTNFSTQICYKIMPSSSCVQFVNLGT